MDGVVVQAVDADEGLADPDGPAHGRAVDFQHLLHLVHDLDGVPPFPVELVDEGHDRCIPQPADLHQLDGALLDALGDVDHHQGGIHCGERAIGVLGEVGVPRGVQQINDTSPVGKLHHGGSDGDSPLLFQLHPVGHRVAAALAGLDRARQLDRAAVLQQALREGRLAGIGV